MDVLEGKFCFQIFIFQGVKLIENSSSQTLDKIEKYICNKVDNLNKRYDKLLSKINLVRQENKYKENIYEQTLFQLEQFKRDNEKNYKMIDSLKAEMNILDVHKKQSEKLLDELKQNLVKKNKEIDDLNMQIVKSNSIYLLSQNYFLNFADYIKKRYSRCNNNNSTKDKNI